MTASHCRDRLYESVESSSTGPALNQQKIAFKTEALLDSNGKSQKDDFHKIFEMKIDEDLHKSEVNKDKSETAVI